MERSLLNTHKHTFYLILVLLFAVTLFSYWGVWSCKFAYDDEGYILENHFIKHGLTSDSIKWAFTSTHASNWHPLTWISHMVDYQVWRMDAFGHHLTSLLFHIANTLLVFFVLFRMTGGMWRSAFVAALFGVHPLHVESVAWVAERKDMLSTFFLLLTLWAYHSYTLRPRIGRYILVAFLFALGLMAKPMLVTLPLVLLLLDYWPLKRKAIIEKIPLFAMSLGSCIITFIAQRSGGSVTTFEAFPLLLRIENALVVYATYIIKMVWPAKLAAFYPFPTSGLPIWQMAGAVLFLVCMSALAICTRRKNPYLLTGWLWYIITLIPVIGIVQVGGQAMADRYTYIPLTGLFLMIAWAVPNTAEKLRYAVSFAASIIVVVLILITRAQVPYWHNDTTLFKHALEVTPDNSVSRTNLGAALLKQKKIDEAIVHLRKASSMKRYSIETYVNLGNAFARKNKWDKAIDQYHKALAAEPNQPNAMCGLGEAFEQQGKTDEAVIEYCKAISANPYYVEAYNNLGGILEGHGEIDKAVEHYSKAIEINPDYADAHYNLGTVLFKLEETEDAIYHLREAIRLRPEFASAHKNLAVALYLSEDYAGAWEEVRLCRKYKAELDPRFLALLSAQMPEPKR